MQFFLLIIITYFNVSFHWTTNIVAMIYVLTPGFAKFFVLFLEKGGGKVLWADLFQPPPAKSFGGWTTFLHCIPATSSCFSLLFPKEVPSESKGTCPLPLAGESAILFRFIFHFHFHFEILSVSFVPWSLLFCAKDICDKKKQAKTQAKTRKSHFCKYRRISFGFPSTVDDKPCELVIITSVRDFYSFNKWRNSR